MKNWIVLAVGVALVLMLGGCQDSLRSPAHPHEAELDRAVRAAKAAYDDRPAISRDDYDRYSALTRSFIFGAVSGFERSENPPAEAFHALHQEARALIATHQDDPIGPRVARFVSRAMLGTILANPSKMDDMPEEARYDALREHLQIQVDLHSIKFKSQIKALKALSQWNLSTARTLAAKALTNYRGFRAHASEPVDIPSWLTQGLPWRVVQEEEEMIQGRYRSQLKYFREHRIEQQLAALAVAE